MEWRREKTLKRLLTLLVFCLFTISAANAEDADFKRLKNEVDSNAVVLYHASMLPRETSASASAIKILTDLGVAFKNVDVTTDFALRSNVLQFADWPTFPVLYVTGELIGGYDIMREMFKAGELAHLLDAKGIAHK